MIKKKPQENVNLNANFRKVHAFLKVNNSMASKTPSKVLDQSI